MKKIKHLRSDKEERLALIALYSAILLDDLYLIGYDKGLVSDKAIARVFHEYSRDILTE